MRRQRATIADHLAQVIEVIELGRRTGLLSIERDDPPGLEEGDIYFVQGAAIYASTGAKSGRIALEALRTWGVCRFAFLADADRPSPNIGPELRGSRPPQTGAARPSGPAARPPAPPLQRSGPPPFPSPPGTPAHSPLQRGPSPTQPLLLITPSQRPLRAPNPQDIPRLAANYHLSWAHRALLLLADGTHTVAELARLAGRSEDEVLRLLNDLIRLGLITLLSS